MEKQTIKSHSIRKAFQQVQALNLPDNVYIEVCIQSSSENKAAPLKKQYSEEVEELCLQAEEEVKNGDKVSDKDFFYALDEIDKTTSQNV